MQKKEKMEEVDVLEQETECARNRIQTREQKMAEIQKFTLFSDTFLSVALEDLAACQYVLRILTGEQELMLKKVKSQYAIQQLASHDASAGALSERVHFLKSEERGREIMCEVTERFWQWGYESGEKAGYENGEKAGYAIGAKDGERRGQRRGERRGERRGARRGKDRIIRTYIKASVEEGCTREQVAERLQRYFALNLEQIGKYMANSRF